MALAPSTPYSILDYNRALGSGNAQQYNQTLQNLQSIPGNTATPTQYSIPTSGGGGGSGGGSSLSVRDQMTKGLIPWDDNLLNQGGGVGTPTISDSDLNGVYNPGMQSLDQQQNLLTNQLLPNQLSAIDMQGQQAKGNIDLQGQQYETQYGQDQNLLGQQNQSALSQASQDYARLQQNASARLGGQSSAGEAANDILGQELLRTRGNIAQAYQNSMGDLTGKHANYLLWMNQQKSSIDSDMAQAKQKVQDTFAQTLQEINNSRGMLESQKAAAKLDAMKQTIAQSQAIDAYRIQKVIDLQALKSQYDMAFQSQAQNIAQQHVNYLTQNPFQGTEQLPQYSGGYPTQDQSSGYIPNRNTQDELSRFLS